MALMHKNTKAHIGMGGESSIAESVLKIDYSSPVSSPGSCNVRSR